MSTRLKYNLNDSVRQIIQIINTEPQFQDLPFKYSSMFTFCKNLWFFVKNNIAYKNDSEGIEEIRTPERTWKDRKSGVDCEDYCIFIATILLKFDINPFLRIVSFSKKDGFSHIYIVIKHFNNVDELILDCCMDDFNKEMPYVDKIDIDVLNPDYSLIPKSGNYAMQVLSGLPALTVDEILKYEGKGGKGKEVGADAGILSQFFTPDWIVKLMWQLCVHYGFKGGNVLEPSCGTGRFMYYGPQAQTNYYAFERDPELSEMAQVLVPKAKIYNNFFETAFLEQIGAFYQPYKSKEKFSWLPTMDLVIGNPPYGIWKNQFSGMFPNLKGINQLEQFFMLQGLKLLRKDGLMCYITASNFASTYEKYYKLKTDMDELCVLVDAYRLPAVFKSTQVPTDILIFRRK